jgi:hypothetical protein
LEGAELGRLKPAQLDREQMSPEQMVEKIRQLQKENDYLTLALEILQIATEGRAFAKAALQEAEAIMLDD